MIFQIILSRKAHLFLSYFFGNTLAKYFRHTSPPARQGLTTWSDYKQEKALKLSKFYALILHFNQKM